MILDILCPIGPGAVDYAVFLRLTGEALKSGIHNIRWRSISDKVSDIPKGFTSLGHVDCSKYRNKAVGMNVGTCLNEGIKRLCDLDSDFVLLVDADVALLANDWDERMIAILKNYDVFGGNRKNENCLAFYGHELNWYRNFPLPAFMAFKSNLCHELDWDMCPDIHPPRKGKRQKNKTYVAKNRDSEICGVPVGTMLKKDTGWKAPYFFYDKGYTKWLIMDEIMRARKFSIPYSSKKEKIYCDKHCTPWHMVEYHLDGDPFCTHLAGSRHTTFASKISRIWRSRIKKYIKNTHNINM